MDCKVVALVLAFVCLTTAWAQNVTSKQSSNTPSATSTQVARVNNNTSDVSTNELSSGFTSFLENEELVVAGRESLRVFVKALKSNRSIDEALTIAVTAYATTRTAREIRGNLKNAKLALDRDFGEKRIYALSAPRSFNSTTLRETDLSKSLGFLTLGSLAVLPPIIFPKYFRSMDESWFAENRQIQKFLTGTLVGASE